MRDPIFFYLWDGSRELFIEKHEFYVDQAKKRLLSQFGNIDSEAQEFGKKCFFEAGRWFDPDRHDPSDFVDQAIDESINYFELLTNLHSQTRLSVIAGMYHEWEKQLRDWLSQDLVSHSQGGRATKARIWKANFKEIFDLLKCFDWELSSRPFFDQLNACRLIVNVYKHGLGPSFTELKQDYPQFLKDILGGDLDRDELFQFSNYIDLRMNDKDLDKFSNAIISFWKDAPVRTSLIPFHEITTRTPEWFWKVIKKDFPTGKTKNNC